MRHWNWDGMVEGNRRRLVALLAGLFVMLGTGEVVPRVLRRRVLALLMPMESALRRLIFVMARDVPVSTRAASPCPTVVPKGTGSGRAPVFRLTDILRDPDPKTRSVPRGKEPRIRSLDDRTPREIVPEPADDDLVDATALRRRMAAMEAALGDLARQARRLARWYARRNRAQAAGKFSREYPLRSGRAPGHRAGGKREVDRLLVTCHDLAVRCLRMVEAERYGR